MSIKEYIIDINERIEDAETSEECQAIANELFDVRKWYKEIIIPQQQPNSDALYAISNELHMLDISLAEYIQAAEKTAAYWRDIERDEETYGTYEEQVNKDYYAGRL